MELTFKQAESFLLDAKWIPIRRLLSGYLERLEREIKRILDKAINEGEIDFTQKDRKTLEEYLWEGRSIVLRGPLKGKYRDEVYTTGEDIIDHAILLTVGEKTVQGWLARVVSLLSRLIVGERAGHEIERRLIVALAKERIAVMLLGRAMGIVEPGQIWMNIGKYLLKQTNRFTPPAEFTLKGEKERDDSGYLITLVEKVSDELKNKPIDEVLARAVKGKLRQSIFYKFEDEMENEKKKTEGPAQKPKYTEETVGAWRPPTGIVRLDAELKNVEGGESGTVYDAIAGDYLQLQIQPETSESKLTLTSQKKEELDNRYGEGSSLIVEFIMNFEDERGSKPTNQQIADDTKIKLRTVERRRKAIREDRAGFNKICPLET